MIKLNVGCGNRKLPGYINIDIENGCYNEPPDVYGDARDLPYSNNHVDEILSVHVFEHFYPQEAVAALVHWRNLLKPGGKVVIECPNILSAAYFLLKYKDNCKAKDYDKMVMWPLYGDPKWQSEVMSHKWGYTPDSLVMLLGEAGFVDAKQKPAQFKKREPRDMRVEAFKPKEKDNA